MSRKLRIEHALRDAFTPSFLAVIDESDQHAVPEGAESHFRVVVVAEAFTEMPRIRRHRAVHRVLERELSGGLHALAIEAWTPDQDAAREAMLGSPECRGGSASERRNADAATR